MRFIMTLLPSDPVEGIFGICLLAILAINTLQPAVQLIASF